MTLDPDLWELVFEGEGLVVCDEFEKNCAPLSGATLSLEPINPARALPGPSSKCFGGEPYSWSDGGDGCGLASTSKFFADCPVTFPW